MKASILGTGEPRPQESGKISDAGPAAKKIGGTANPTPLEAKGETETIVAQEVPEEARPELRAEIQRLTDEILRDLKMVGIEALIKARDEALLALERLEQSLSKFREDKETLQSKLRSTIHESTEALARGEKTKDVETRKTKADLCEAEGWIDELERVAVPEAIERVKGARKALATGFALAVRETHLKWESRMQACILSALDLYQAWKIAHSTYQDRVGLRPVDVAREGLPLENSLLRFPLTGNIRSQEFLSLSLGNKRHI